MFQTFHAILLVCAASMPHDVCNEKNAKHVYRGITVHSMSRCALDPQALIAPQEGLFDPRTQYLKMGCKMQMASSRTQSN